MAVSDVHWGSRSGRVLRYLHDYTTEHGYPPSVRQVADATGGSVSTIHHEIQLLEARGHITRTVDRGVTRALTIHTPPPEE